MANYAIMRCKKLTGMGSVASALQHCYRERETPNANAERTPENYCSVSKSTDQAMGRVRELLPEKRRMTLKTSRRFPLMYSSRASLSPSLMRLNRDAFSSSFSMGSVDVFTPQISTL